MEGKTLVAPPGGDLAEVHGSSFAAPRLSASIAVYLLTGGASPCDGHLPVLGYTNSGLWEQQDWQDLSLGEAAADHCDGYIDHTTL